MRSRILTSAFVAFLVAVASVGASAQGDTVTIFNGKDGTGANQPLPVGTFQVSGKQLGSTEASVKVAKDYNVRFCSGADGTGKCEEFGEGTHNLTSLEFNFIKIWKGSPTSAGGTTLVSTPSAAPTSSGPPPLLVYEQLNWGGRAQGFQTGMYRSFKEEFGKLNDNQARSVVIAKGYRVRFCAEEGRNYRGAGDCEIHEEGRHNLRFSNAISFIEVADLADKSPDDEKLPVVLYEDPSQVGKMQGFDVGTFSGSKGDFKKLGNDNAGSIVVKDGYHATVCSDEPASGGEPGACEEFGPGRKNLKTQKAASYLKVSKD